MKNKFKIAFILILFILSFSCKEEMNSDHNVQDKATQIVQQSISYLDPNSLVSSLKTIDFTLTTKLYNDWGGIEDSIYQEHHYEFSPVVSGVIKWNRKDSIHSIHYKNGNASYFINSSFKKDSLSIANAYSSFINAFNAIMSPFNLLDAGKQLKYEGREIKPLIGPADIVALTFEDSLSNKPLINNKSISYYFDPENQKLLAHKESYGDSTVLHINKRERDVDGIKLLQYRKSYNFDNADRIDRLRAEYFYENISLGFQK